MDNREFNILITSSSRKVSLVRSFEEALREMALKGRVYAADTSPLSASLYHNSANAVISPGTGDEKAYLKWLEKFCAMKNIKLIIPTRDEELILFARIRSAFRKKGIYINISSEDAIGICNDKWRFYEYCERRHIPVPKVFKDMDSVVYPCFIKGRYGKGSRLSFKISNKAQLRAISMIFKEYVIQEYVNWPEYTVDYFADFKARPISAIPRERALVFGGESFVGCIVKNKILINAVLHFAAGLGLVGHNTIQLFYNAKTKKIKFIEVNPRFGGAASLGIAAGANTPLFLIKLALNQPIGYRLNELDDDLCMLRYTEDFFIKRSQLLK